MVGGTAMTFTAILVLHAAPFQLGALNAMRIVPALVMSLAAGAWVDRVRRRPILIGADLGRALLLLTIPAAALAGILHIEQLYVVALIVSVLTLLFDVAYQSYLPGLVGKRRVQEANSKLSASAAVAEFGGFSLGGWLVQALSAPLTVLVDAASFLVSAFSIGWIRKREDPPVRAARSSLWHEVLEGLRTVRANRLLRASAVAIGIQQLSSGIYGALVVLYMSQGLGFAPGILGMIWAVGGVSSLVGALLAPRFSKRLGFGTAMTLGLGVFGVTQALVPIASGASVASALLLVGGQLGDGFCTIYEINQVSLQQGLASRRLLGRVNATIRFLSLGAALAGALIGGWLGEAVGVRPMLALGAIGTLGAAVVLAASPVRAHR